MNTEREQKLLPRALILLILLPLLLAAFLIRFDLLLARIFHIDEFISMLAAQMTALKGAPVLPSGLLYRNGLLASYVAAPFVAVGSRFSSGLAGSEEMARWPSLLVGMLSISVYYGVGRRLFRSQSVGLALAGLAALDSFMILWATRVRMYALAGLFMPLALAFLILGVLLRPARRYRIAAALCFLGAVLSHAVSLLAAPAWLAAAALTVLVCHRRLNLSWFRQRSIWFEVGLLVLIVCLGFAFGVLGQISFLSGTGMNEGGWLQQLGTALGKFLEPGISWQRVDDYIYYHITADYWPLTALGAFALIGALLAAIRRRLTWRDALTFFLAAVFLFTILEVSLALTSMWRKSRYIYVLCLPPFLLLAADGLDRLLRLLVSLAGRRRAGRSPWLVPLGLLLVLGLWGGTGLHFLGSSSTGSYDRALTWVRQAWRQGDEIMTVHPSAAYLYLGRSDYYATQRIARVVEDEEDNMTDPYVGSRLIGSVPELNALLQEKTDHLWFVVDHDRLFGRYESLFFQQVFAQMELLHEVGGVAIFRGRPFPNPLPEQPAQPLAASFSGKIRLEGYVFEAAALTAAGRVRLVLFWRPEGQVDRPYKVFVQLRDEQNQTSAQADHFIWNGLLTQPALEHMRNEDDWIRDSVDLLVPPDLPAGRYRLLVGLYDPVTSERVPVIGDQSGENAVALEEFVLP